jgi:predicted nucleic acid-binding protein
MSGRSVLLDTNTVLYFLAGDETISEFIRDKKIYISVISELELLAYNELTQQEIKLIQSFIRDIDIIDISLDIKALSIQLRRQTRLKLPDCIIAATSMVLQLPLITADKGMKQVLGLDLIFYEK